MPNLERSSFSWAGPGDAVGRVGTGPTPIANASTLGRLAPPAADLPALVDVHRALFEYIELFYNGPRRHSILGYLGPLAFERQWRDQDRAMTPSPKLGQVHPPPCTRSTSDGPSNALSSS